MNINDLMNTGRMDFSSTELRPFLLGLLSAFDNRYQACADKFFQEITWKQFFAIICINLCEGAPTLNELSDIMGTSHQNVKQILLKMERNRGIILVRVFITDLIKHMKGLAGGGNGNS